MVLTRTAKSCGSDAPIVGVKSAIRSASDEAIHSSLIASRNLSSGARSRDPFAPRNDGGRPALPQHDPRWRMVAGAFLASYLAVDAGLDQARRDGRAEQKMIEPQSGVARPAVSLVIPKRVHRLRRMKIADRIEPALRHQRFERGTTLRLDQRIVVP